MPWEMITSKLEKMSDPDFEVPDWKAKKQEMRQDMFETMLTSQTNSIMSILGEISSRNTIDSLAKVTKELPTGKII